MRFFTDKADYTHRVRFYCFPAYARFRTTAEGPGADIEGTNIVSDWCILYIVPVLHELVELIRGAMGDDGNHVLNFKVVEDMRKRDNA